jgi:nitric oxide reductase large subunit
MRNTRRIMPNHKRGSISTSILGVIVFLVGVALLAFTFKLAYDMFMVPPQDALGIKPKQPIDLGMAGQSFVGLIVKVLMLVVMGLMGSLIANRGVSMFAGSRVHPKPPPPQPSPPSPEA